MWIRIIFLLVCLFAQAQEGNEKLKGHRISFAPLTGFFVAEQNPSAGLSFHLDATFLYKKQRYKFAMNTGFDSLYNILGEPHTSYGYLDLGALYGREWSLLNWLYAEGYVGASFFAKIVNTKKTDESGKDRQVETYTSTIGIPLHAQLRFQLSERFSLGLQYHGNINHLNIVNSFGLAFGFRLGLNKKYDFEKKTSIAIPSKKLRYHSFHIGGQTVYPHDNAAYIPISGPTWSVSFVAGKHIFKCRTAMGSGTQPAKSDDRAPVSGFFSFPNFSKGDPSNYEEQSLLYGRAFRPLRRMVTELYTGIAHIDYTNQYHNIKTKQFGVPLQTEIRVYLTKTFALGVNGGITLSNKHSNHYWGAALRWNAKRFKYE